MKPGDLVNFHTSAWVFKHAERRYANPGIVLRVKTDGPTLGYAEIMWADKKITVEHDSYLRSAEEKNETR